IENKSFLEIVENKSNLSQKEHGLDILSDNNILKSDLNLETISPLKLESNPTESNEFISNDIRKIGTNLNTSIEIKQEEESSIRVKNVLEKYKFKFGNESSFSSNLNKSFSTVGETSLSSNTIESKENKSFITSEINKNHDDIAKTQIKINNDINIKTQNSETSLSKLSTLKSLNNSSESIKKIHQSPKSYFKNNSYEKIFNNNNNNNDDEKSIIDNKSNSFSIDNSPSYIEMKENKINNKRSSLSSLNLTHFNLNSKNESINKRIEEIRERLKLNEKRKEKSKGENLKDSSMFQFEAKSETGIISREIKAKLNLENHESPKISNEEDNSDETNELLNSSSFEQLEISSKNEKRPPSKKKPFSLDSLKNLSNDSFSLNLNLSSTSSNSASGSSHYSSKRSSIPTFSQFYSSNKSFKESKKSKSTSLLNIPKSQSPSPTIEQQLTNSSSTFRVAKYARLNNTKLPMPSKAPRKLYDEYLNSRGDLSSSSSSSSEIKPVEPRKQAIPISKLRQPSKLRLRPNILVSYKL
ncbi:hypothetical protein PIROE2DRAFT_1866, partial [Piromyces sp. E2]